jgi:hypothetical protein
MASLTWGSVADESAMSKFWWVFTFPIQVAFKFTVPNCNYEVVTIMGKE